MPPKDPKEDATTEPNAGSNSAATEHTEEPQLVELVNQEASMSTEIELQGIRNEIVDYTYPWQGNQVPTQKVQIILQSKNRSAVLPGCCQTAEERQTRTQKVCAQPHRCKKRFERPHALRLS